MNTLLMQTHDRKINVLHIITNLPIGGAQDNTLLTVELLDRAKYNVALMCAPEGEWVERAKSLKNTEIIFVKQLTRPIRPVRDLRALYQVYRILRGRRFDIVHTHSSKPGVVGRIAARMTGVPVVVHTIHGFPFHDFMNPLLRRLFIVIERFLVRFCDKLITVSNLNLEKAVSLKFAAREKFRNIYSGIDFKKFDIESNGAAKKAEIGIMNGERIVGMVGRLSEQKAPLDFVGAIPAILKSYPDVQFVLVGDGELKKKTLSYCRSLGVDNKVRILGFREDIPELLPLFDVYVLTSHWEGLGRALTEAMYTGRPVVATNVEGVPELVEHGKTGVLVEAQDIKAIADGIIALLTDRKTALTMGEAASQKIGKLFQAETMVHRIEELYQELLNEKGIVTESKLEKPSHADLPN